MLETRKCLHVYHYYQHPDFGLMHVRVQTWFPFTVDLCLNGREWLARQMDRAALHYVQRDNCFTWVEQPDRVQALLERQLQTDWPNADSDESGHLFQSISDTVPGLSDSCRSEATL